LEDHHNEEVDIGKFGELVNEILGEEGNDGILGGLNVISAVLLRVFLPLLDLEDSQRVRLLPTLGGVVQFLLAALILVFLAFSVLLGTALIGISVRLI
jgi:hypothetical protein